MKLKNIHDVIDKLEELQGKLEDMIDESYEVNDIAWEFMDYAVNSNLKNYLAGFAKLADMGAVVYDKIGDLKAVADGLSDGIEAETEEQAK